MGTISMTEQAAVNADVAGDGQMWVKTATPNQLWFTDDAGTDFQLASLAGTETLTNKTLTSPTINGATSTSSSIITPTRLDVKQDIESVLTTYASTATNGQLCFATNTKKLYQYNPKHRGNLCKS